MALLCGSDYSDGVPGIGKESVLKFFEKLSDEQVFDRIKTWRTKPDLFDELESCISDKDICKSCGHHGKLQAHTKNGKFIFLIKLMTRLYFMFNEITYSITLVYRPQKLLHVVFVLYIFDSNCKRIV